MPRKRFLNLPPEERSKLLDIALAEFAERGFDEASLNQILASAGVSKGVYYYYFEDKEDLFATTVENAVERALGRHPLPSFEDVTRKTFWPAAEEAFLAWAALLEGSADLLRVLRHITPAQRRSPRFAAVLERGQVFWRTLIDAGQKCGAIRKDLSRDVLVELVEAADHVLDKRLLEGAAPVTRKSVARHLSLLLDTARRLLSAPER